MGKNRQKRPGRLISIRCIMIAGIFISIWNSPASSQSPIRPMTASPYQAGTILPEVSRHDLDSVLLFFYNDWKSKYLQNVPGKEQSYVLFVDPEHPGQICTSEGQGYGMLITVLMAKFDPTAQGTYERLLNYRMAHESSKKTHMMSWKQRASFKNSGKSAASDGDIDIAYSLLLAARQWPAKTAAYSAAANQMIGNIMNFEINKDQWTVLLGDEEEHINADKAQGVKEYSSDNYYDTRTSDFMPATFSEFAKSDQRWSKVIDAEYHLFYVMEETYSHGTGLVPDFVSRVNTMPIPSKPNFKETKYDGQYFNNACRVPWRLGVDYLQNGSDSAKHFLTRINHWIKKASGGDTSRVFAGYYLTGMPIDTNNERFYSSPFAVSSMIDTENQLWLNKSWTYITEPHDFMYGKGLDYFGDCINMVDLIIITGNYWPAFKLQQ